jgi:hypothetical protein
LPPKNRIGQNCLTQASINGNSCGSRREPWFESFLEQELSLGLWKYQDKDVFPIWAEIRNTIATRLAAKEKNYNQVIHAPTSRPDYVFRYPLEHFRVIKNIFMAMSDKHDACFFVPAATLINGSKDTIKKTDRIHGGYYTFFKYPLIFQKPHQGKFSRLVVEVEPSNIYYFPTIQIFSKLVEKIRFFSTDKDEQKLLLEIAKKSEKISKKTVSKDEALHLLKHTKARQLFYKFFVRKIAAKIAGKIVFLNCGCYLGSNAILSWNFHKHGFTVIEPQHGYIGPNHHSYNYPKGIFKIPRVREVFPDYFLTFGEKWGQNISIPSQIIPVGNKYLEDYVKTNLPKKDDGSNILVVSQGTVTERMVGIAKTIATAFPEKNIIFKLHPGEIPFKERYQELEAFGNIEIIGFQNILPLIAKSKYIVGYNSTTLFEALAFPGKKIFCPPNSYTCGEKGFNLFETSEQLVQMIRKGQGKISDGVAEEYWSPNWANNVKRLPFLTIKEPL